MLYRMTIIKLYKPSSYYNSATYQIDDNYWFRYVSGIELFVQSLFMLNLKQFIRTIRVVIGFEISKTLFWKPSVSVPFPLLSARPITAFVSLTHLLIRQSNSNDVSSTFLSTVDIHLKILAADIPCKECRIQSSGGEMEI